MKKLIALAFTLGIAAFGKAQKVINDPNIEVRSIGAFEGVSVSGGIDLYFSTGDEVVAISAATPEHRDRIKTEVKGGVLKIWYESKGLNVSWGGDRKMKAYVSARAIKRLSASGGSDVLVDGTITTSELKIDLSGGSDFKGKVETNILRVDQSGGSDVAISGKAANLKVQASGGSDFNGYDLVTEVCDVQASGGSDIEITANKELSAQASGASDVRYKGTAQVRNVQASGASSVRAKS